VSFINPSIPPPIHDCDAGGVALDYLGANATVLAAGGWQSSPWCTTATVKTRSQLAVSLLCERIAGSHVFTVLRVYNVFVYFLGLMASCAPKLEETEGSKKTQLITTLRQHLADNARMLGSVRHDWDYVRYVRSEDMPVVPC
jgi:hypothetical protein